MVQLALAAVLMLAQGNPSDTVVYRDAATEVLVAGAAARHARQVSELDRYVARVRSRMDASVSATRFGPGLRILDMDLVARVHWQRPMDLSVELLGARTKVARLPGANRDMLGGWFLGLVTADPWFAPGAMGDEIDFMGIPDEPALHPLAPGADRWYRYAIVDSVHLILPGRIVRSVAVSVEPRRYERSLVRGTMWLDADSLDVVRMTVAFVGTGLWDDDDDAPQLVGAEADLEYALHDGRFWLPYRQILTLDWRYRYLPGAVLPARAVSTFEDYLLTEVPPITVHRRTSRARMERVCEPWSRRAASECGTRAEVRSRLDHGRLYQLVIPPLDSLARFDFGDAGGRAGSFDDEAVGRRLTEMALQGGTLPPAARVSPRTLVHPAIVAALRDGIRFNRAQGPSLGGTAHLRLGAFTALEPTARLSAGDERLTGGLLVRRETPARDVWVEAHHQLREAETWTSGQSLTGTLRAAFLGDDAAEYYLVTGTGAGVTWRLGRDRGTRVEIGWERQRSVMATDGSVLHDVLFGDGRLPANPAITEGEFARMLVRRRFGDAVGPTVELGVEGLAGRVASGARAWVVGDAAFGVAGRRARLTARAGHMLGDALPQLEFRAGGRFTVRGYEYGMRRGRGVWSVQSEVEIVPNEWVAPLLIADVGDVIGGGSGDPLVGVGLGLSIGNGWLRIDLVKGVHPSAVVRADLGMRLPVW